MSKNCTFCGISLSDFSIKISSKIDQNYCSYTCLNRSKIKGCEMCAKRIDFSRKNDRICVNNSKNAMHYCSYSCLELFIEKNRNSLGHY